MSVLLLLIGLAALWLLWRIARHASDALDRQAAIQVELAAVNRRLRVIESQMVNADSAGESDSPE